MMYIQLTDRCNMTCEHCCFAAKKSGRRMSDETFGAALELACNIGSPVTIGGGEPTLHPKFKQFFIEAAEAYQRKQLELPPLVITNGSITKIGHWLLDLFENEQFEVCIALSQDAYHNEIDQYLVERWNRVAKNYKKFRRQSLSSCEIRSVSRIINTGRAVNNSNLIHEYFKDNNTCPCEDSFIDPIGNIFACGCKTLQLGHVLDENILEKIGDSEFGFCVGDSLENFEN